MSYTDLDSIHRATDLATAPTAWGDTVNDDVAYLFGDATWTAPTFANSWVNFATGNNNVGFRRVGSLVIFRGVMSSGAINATAFTMPVGYRPPANIPIATVSNSAFGYLNVLSTGAVVPAVGSNIWWSLEGVFFSLI